ncbi:fimbrial protein [Pantoea ananatis]|uniref:fimbrial protein n=1 Tax=Pantoea ananas TaxID=553 RepID=UPI000AB7F945|nr:fimbrial protein [Pantoea ananatis]
METGMFLRCFLVSLFVVICQSVQAAQWIDRGHGHVHVNGQIQESACSIHTDDVWQEVTFPVFSANALLNSGQEYVFPFSLRLVNCKLARKNGKEWKSVNVTFEGDRVLTQPDLFAVRGETQGFALAVSDNEGHQASPGVTMDGVPLSSEGNELYYQLSVVPTGEKFREGKWSGIIRFMVSYQ